MTWKNINNMNDLVEHLTNIGKELAENWPWKLQNAVKITTRSNIIFAIELFNFAVTEICKLDHHNWQLLMDMFKMLSFNVSPVFVVSQALKMVQNGQLSTIML